jgi:hypothetical protein
MKLLLFLDYSFLDRCDGAHIKFLQPKPIDNASLKKIRGIFSIIYDEKQKRFRIWDSGLDKTPFHLLESKNGLDWSITDKTIKSKGLRHHMWESDWFYDRWDRNSEFRYKMVTYPYEKGTYGGPGIIATSPDGIRWTNHPEFEWAPRDGNGSDTSNHMFYNPFTKEYVVFCRRYHVDRRLATVRSKDLKNWTQGEVVLQPDPLDPPLMQFYGTTTTLYENEYFMGLVQCYKVPSQLLKHHTEIQECQMYGYVEPQLIWSFNSTLWNRSDRTPFLSRGEPGERNFGSIYPRKILPAPDGKHLYVYSRVSPVNHGVKRDRIMPKVNGRTGFVTMHSLRKDGFSCLEPDGGYGEITTKCIIPKTGDLKLNYKAPYGELKVQIADPSGKPLKGYTYDECTPLKGDYIMKTPKWKNRKDLAELKGKSIRIQVKFIDAYLYAIRVNCILNHMKPATTVERL